MKIKANKFSASLIALLAFSIPASILNYVFSIAIGRLLTVEEFGIYNSMNSMANNVIAIYAPFAVLVTRITAESKDIIGENTDRYKQIFKIYLCFFAITSLAGMLLYPLLKGRFGADSFAQWLLILIMIGIMGLHSLAFGFVQGTQRFMLYGFLNCLLMAVKLVMFVGGIRAGGGFAAVIFAMLLSHLLIVIICSCTAKKACESIYAQEIGTKEIYSLKDITSLYGLTFLVQLIYMFYVNGGEIVFMNFFCDDTEIGLYSSIITLAKICVYLISTFNAVLLPIIAGKADDLQGGKKTLYASLIFTVICSALFAVVMLVGGKWFIPFMWGEKYLPALKYLGASLMYAIPLANLMVVHTYMLGRGKLEFYTAVLSLMLIVSAAAASLLSDNISAVPVSFGTGMIITLIVTLIYIVKEKENV